MTSVGRLVGKIPLKTLHTPHADFLNSCTLIGVEVEAENVKLPKGQTWDGVQYWHPHADDSLRNDGCEFAFVSPLFGADAVTAIKGLCKLAKEKGFKTSARTGLHVHVDVRDLSLEQFRAMCVLYAMVEKMIYRWVGGNREENIFCLPWYHSEGDLDALGNAFKTNTESDVHHIFNGMLRYSGLNLQAVAKFGSAEFRHMPTTFDYERIRTWINIILSLRDAAVAWTGTPESLLKEFRTLGCMRFMSKVFPLSVLKELWYPEAQKDVIESGLITADHLLRISSKETKGRINFDSIYKRYKTLRGKNAGVALWESKHSPIKKGTTDIEEWDAMVRCGDTSASHFPKPRSLRIVDMPNSTTVIFNCPKNYPYDYPEWVVSYMTIREHKTKLLDTAPRFMAKLAIKTVQMPSSATKVYKTLFGSVPPPAPEPQQITNLAPSLQHYVTLTSND